MLAGWRSHRPWLQEMILDYIRSHIPRKVHITGSIVATWLLPVDPFPTCRGQLLLQFCQSHCFARSPSTVLPSSRSMHQPAPGQPSPAIRKTTYRCVVLLYRDFTAYGCLWVAVCPARPTNEQSPGHMWRPSRHEGHLGHVFGERTGGKLIRSRGLQSWSAFSAFSRRCSSAALRANSRR